jgi:hypothetical protein
MQNSNKRSGMLRSAATVSGWARHQSRCLNRFGTMFTALANKGRQAHAPRAVAERFQFGALSLNSGPNLCRRKLGHRRLVNYIWVQAN